MPAPLPIEKLTDDQRKLIEDNMDVIYWFFDKLGIYNEDWKQDCFYAICRYIHLYDPTRGSIATFLRAIIISRRNTVYKRERTIKENLNAYALRFEESAYEDDEGDTLTWGDIIGNVDEGFNKLEDRDLYNRFMDDLCKSTNITKSQFKNFVAYINLGNFEEVGRLYGTSRQAVQQSVDRVREKLRRKNNRTKLFGP